MSIETVSHSSAARKGCYLRVLSGPVATVPAMTMNLPGMTGVSVVWTDMVSAVATGVAALAALATLVVAILAVRYTRTQLADARSHTQQQLIESRKSTQQQLDETRNAAQLQLDEARDLRRAQAAPYVVIYARPHDEISGTLIDLVIENTGNTGARDITFTSTPPLIRTDGHGGSQPVQLPDPLPFLAPHQSWRTFWDAGTTRRGTDLESRFTVTAAYTDTLGERRQEQFVLDLDQFRPRMYPDERTVHHIGKAVEDLAGTVKAWSHRDDVVRVATYDGAEFDQQQARDAAKQQAVAEELRAAFEGKVATTSDDITDQTPDDKPPA